jgi:hypothetical protein
VAANTAPHWKTGCGRNGNCTGAKACATSLFLLTLTAFAQTGTPWPEADRIFHSDPRWLGADAAFSVDLGGGRVLWLFGDTFVASKPGQTRRQSRMARNTIAIQNGYDPSTASIQFYWQENGTGSFFPDEGKTWYWPSHGIRLGERLLLFYDVVKANGTPGPFGFQEDGWTAFLISNPDDDPPRWKVRKLDAPTDPWHMLVGIAVVREDDQLYLFAADEPKHDGYLLRLPVSDAAAGRFSGLQWWCGERRGWLARDKIAGHPEPLFHDGATEFSVHRDAAGGRYVQVQTVGFGGTDIGMRMAERLTGPWSALKKVYRPPESDRPEALVYAGKAHPELKGADVIVTYAQNGPDARLWSDPTIYFPRFVRLSAGK